MSCDLPPGTLAAPLRCTLRRPTGTDAAVLALVHATAYPLLQATAAQFLHAHEAVTYTTLQAPQRQQSFLLGRYVAKQALGTFLREPVWRRIEIVPGVFTQPVVHYPTPTPVEVSITHGGAWAGAIAFPSGHPIGIDVERLDAASLEAMRTQSTDTEWEAAVQSVGVGPLPATVLWTAKEALAKVLKCGLMAPWTLFETVDVVPVAAGYCGQFRHFGQYQFHTWVLRDHVLSLVLPKWTTLEGDLVTWVRPLLCA